MNGLSKNEFKCEKVHLADKKVRLPFIFLLLFAFN